MSALPPKADMFSVEMNVCFVPIPDISICSQCSVQALHSSQRLRDTRALSLHAVADYASRLLGPMTEKGQKPDG